MNAICNWVGKTVLVTLRTTAPATLQGQLLNVDESGTLLQLPQGATFVPVTSILHVTLVEERRPAR